MKRTMLAVGAALLAAATAYADTLVLTNGRRVQGELIAVSEGEIEFEERSGLVRRMVRVSKDEVARIEFTNGSSNSSRYGRDDESGVIPRGMRERQVNVIGNERWTDTGIDVREGQLIYFISSGEVRWGPKHRKHGAAGEPRSPVNHNRPIPDRPAAALIGRVGDPPDAFFIGAEMGPFRARSSGRLYLAINDDWLEDNQGHLTVKVSY